MFFEFKKSQSNYSNHGLFIRMCGSIDNSHTQITD